MRTISDGFKQWKSSDGIDRPLATFYEIEVDDNGTKLRLMEGAPTGKNVETFLGETYTAAAITSEDRVENIESDLFSSRISISNIDGVAGGYIETNDLEGREVTISHVPTNLISSAVAGDYVQDSYTIQDQSYDRVSASITLGHPGFMKRRVPFGLYLRHKCSWNYARRFEDDSGCFYPSDYFEDDTKQTLDAVTVDTEAELKHGIFILNATKARAADVSTTASGSLHISNDDDTVTNWLGSTRTGPFVFKKIDGDFDAYTEIASSTLDANSGAGILIQTTADDDDWYFVFFGNPDAGMSEWDLTARTSSGDQKTSSALNDTTNCLRVSRSGSSLTVYHSSDYTTWVSWHSDTITGWGSEVRIGLAIINASTGSASDPLSANFSFLRFKSGGLPTCSRTVDGTDGCSAHNNQAHFGAFVGIPRAN